LRSSAIPTKVKLLIHLATGVEKYDVSLENQTAEIVTKDDTLPYETVLTTIKKTGKKVKSGEADGKDMPIE
jgi:copper chaperone